VLALRRHRSILDADGKVTRSKRYQAACLYGTRFQPKQLVHGMGCQTLAHMVGHLSSRVQPACSDILTASGRAAVFFCVATSRDWEALLENVISRVDSVAHSRTLLLDRGARGSHREQEANRRPLSLRRQRTAVRRARAQLERGTAGHLH
jgi:hypothetical protein